MTLLFWSQVAKMSSAASSDSTRSKCPDLRDQTCSKPSKVLTHMNASSGRNAISKMGVSCPEKVRRLINECLASQSTL